MINKRHFHTEDFESLRKMDNLKHYLFMNSIIYNVHTEHNNSRTEEGKRGTHFMITWYG